MKGAIIGDIIGSAFIKSNQLITDFQLLKPNSAYTEDTVLTLATADTLIYKGDFGLTLKKWIRLYPRAGYSSQFLEWALGPQPTMYQCKGNGAARRISPIGLAAKSLNEALTLAKKATKVTHNIEEKIEASQAVTAATFLSKHGKSKEEIKYYLVENFQFDLNKSLGNFTEDMKKYESGMTPAPAAIKAFLESENYEDAIRKAISLGGPSNTIASITGGIAHAFYKHIPKSIVRKSLSRLSTEMVELINQFDKLYTNASQDIKKEIHI